MKLKYSKPAIHTIDKQHASCANGSRATTFQTCLNGTDVDGNCGPGNSLSSDFGCWSGVGAGSVGCPCRTGTAAAGSCAGGIGVGNICWVGGSL